MEDLTTMRVVAAACVGGTIALLFLTTCRIMIFLRRRSSRRLHEEEGRRAAALPPVVSVVSLLACLPTLLTCSRGGLPGVLHGLHTKLGSVFTVSLFFGMKKVTFLVGPEATAHFFQGSESEIRQSDIYRVTVPVFGPGVAFDVDFATRSRQISFCSDAIRPASLRSHVDAMVEEVEAYFAARWGKPHGVVDLKHEMGKVILVIANRCFLGKHIRDTVFDEVAELVDELFDNGFSLVSLLYPYLPTPAHRRRDRARARLGELIHEAVRSRRRRGADSTDTDTDVLQRFVESKYINGRPMTETEIAGLLVCMIFAAQHTSSSASVWTGACLLHRQHNKDDHLAAAVEEQEQIVRRHGDRLDHAILREMDTLHCCIKEALRLHPPASLLIRHASKGFAVRTREGGEYHVPKGHTLVTCTAVSNRLPHIYRDPDVFDPTRFGAAAGREEDKVGGRFSYTSFGGGRHVCLGEEYAYMQIKVIWSHLLRNFELEMRSPFPEDEWDKFIPGPRGQVMVSYKRRDRPADVLINTKK